jgi:hypothetical protein
MLLSQIATGAASVPLPSIGADKELSTELQKLMGTLGVLDPPADGAFGPISRWAFDETLARLGVVGKAVIDAEVANRLLGIDPRTLFPVNPGTDFAGRIVSYMLEREYWLSRHPDCLNIIYVEGCDETGKPNGNAPNEFNDLRLVLRINPPTGAPQIVDAWPATTEPGRFYTQNPMDPNGAARIAFGQFKSWSVGFHGTGTGRHEALVQVAEITVFRDKNRDYRRDGDKAYTGLFGVDQHWGYDLPLNDIRNASAGCLVGRTTKGHREFIAAIKADPRYQTSTGYRFMTTIVPGDKL